jgi:hypothetical protein
VLLLARTVAAIFVVAGLTGKAALAMQAAVGVPVIFAAQPRPRITAASRFNLFLLNLSCLRSQIHQLSYCNLLLHADWEWCAIAKHWQA